MLILTRQIGQAIVIGENGEVKLTIISKQGNKVRVGIEAPKEIAVNREEIFKAKKQDQNAVSEKSDQDEPAEQCV